MREPEANLRGKRGGREVRNCSTINDLAHFPSPSLTCGAAPMLPFSGMRPPTFDFDPFGPARRLLAAGHCAIARHKKGRPWPPSCFTPGWCSVHALLQFVHQIEQGARPERPSCAALNLKPHLAAPACSRTCHLHPTHAPKPTKNAHGVTRGRRCGHFPLKGGCGARRST